MVMQIKAVQTFSKGGPREKKKYSEHIDGTQIRILCCLFAIKELKICLKPFQKILSSPFVTLSCYIQYFLVYTVFQTTWHAYVPYIKKKLTNLASF